jgi:hypothetical protein
MGSPIEIARGLRRRRARHDEWNEDVGSSAAEARDGLVFSDPIAAKPGATDDALRPCPERWLGAGTHGDPRAMLPPLLDLPVERILTSHGEPVLAGGREAPAGVLA